MCLTLRSHVEPKIARLSSSYVQPNCPALQQLRAAQWLRIAEITYHRGTKPPGAATRVGSSLAALWNEARVFF
jgi:hypothetical protein